MAASFPLPLLLPHLEEKEPPEGFFRGRGLLLSPMERGASTLEGRELLPFLGLLLSLRLPSARIGADIIRIVLEIIRIVLEIILSVLLSNKSVIFWLFCGFLQAFYISSKGGNIRLFPALLTFFVILKVIWG